MHPPLPGSPDARHAVRILYVDDVPELCDLAQLVFTREGYSIECVGDGVEALERLLSDNLAAFDLVITDHHMPRMSGLDLVLAIRALPYYGKLMVFCSDLNPAIADEYRRLNVDRILFKPIYPSCLRQAIAELFPEQAETPLEQDYLHLQLQ